MFSGSLTLCPFSLDHYTLLPSGSQVQALFGMVLRSKNHTGFIANFDALFVGVLGTSGHMRPSCLVQPVAFLWDSGRALWGYTAKAG